MLESQTSLIPVVVANEANTRIIARAFPVLLCLILLLLAVSFVWTNSFSGVEPWDDEGLFILTFRDLVQGRHLYDEVAAMYGPFYFLTTGGLFAILHFPLTHDVARLVTAIFWISIALTLSGFVFRVTRSLSAAGLGLIMTLVVLRILPGSPTHPEEICLLLLSCLPHALYSMERGARNGPLLAIAAILAALLLTKINAGVFALLALSMVALRSTRGAVMRNLVFAGIAIGSVLLPFELMRPLFQFGWALAYSVFASATIGSAILILWRSALPEMLSSKQLATAIAVFCVTGATIIALGCLVYGSSLVGMMEATVLQGPDFIQNWHVPVHFGITGAISTIAASATALGYIALKSRPDTSGIADSVIAGLKLVIGLAGIALIYGVGISSPLHFDVYFRCFAPFAWVFIVPPPRGNPRARLARAGVGMLAALMVLYPFPVAGAQIGDSLFLAAAMVPILLQDAITHLATLTVTQRLQDLGRREIAGPTAALLLLIGLIAEPAWRAVAEYDRGVSLGLPGSVLIHVEPRTAANYQWAVREISKCRSFFTYPRQASFWLWTGLPAPMRANFTADYALLSTGPQQRIVADLSEHGELCVLSRPEVYQFYVQDQLPLDQTLPGYIARNYSLFAKQGPFEVLKQNPAANRPV